jgi:pyruvate dehydrogenase E2 component (dihydrolipoamide acetyltransferase)
MPVDVLMPKLGLTMQEGTIEEWLVEPGTAVEIGVPLLRLATDKVDVEVESEGSGRFFPAVAAGTAVVPGAVVGWLMADGEQPPGTAPRAAGAAPATVIGGGAEPARPHTASPVDGRLKSSPLARAEGRRLGVDLSSVAGTGPAGRIVAADVRDHAVSPSAGAMPAASPLVRRQAEALRIDLAAVQPSGAGGRIRRADVEATAARVSGRDDAPAEHAPAEDAPQIVPLTGMRAAIARAMTASLAEMAQLTQGFEADVSALVALRAQLKAEARPHDQPPTVNDFVVRACALGLREHPMLNASVVGKQIRLHRQIHIGMAVAVPGGLVVPVLRHADRGPLLELSRQTRRLASAARAGNLAAADLEGATFAVSSLGSYGIDFFTPVINLGNAAIMGVGRIRDGVRWDADVPRRTSVLTLSLTFDHRVVDGAPAADYLRAVADLLARPTYLLAGSAP